MRRAVVDDETTYAIVTDNGKSNGSVVGVLSAPIYMRNVLDDGLDMFNTPIHEVMDASPFTCSSSDSCVTAMSLPPHECTHDISTKDVCTTLRMVECMLTMHDSRCWHVLVLNEDGMLEGELILNDILSYMHL